MVMNPVFFVRFFRKGYLYYCLFFSKSECCFIYRYFYGFWCNVKILKTLLYAFVLVFPYAFSADLEACLVAECITGPCHEKKSSSRYEDLWAEYEEQDSGSDPVFFVYPESSGDFFSSHVCLPPVCVIDAYSPGSAGISFCTSGLPPFVRDTECCAGERSPPFG